MRTEDAWDAILTPLSELVAAHLGLHFPRERHADLRRGVCGAAKEAGSEDPLRYAESLLSNPLSREQLAMLAAQFGAVNPGAILHRNAVNRPRPQPVVISARTPVTAAPAPDVPMVFFKRPAANEPHVKPPEKFTDALASLTRRLASEGRLSEALVWSKQWVSAEKLNAAAHFLHAMIAQELGDLEAARRSLQKSIYLQPDFALGHFALGNLARRESRQREAVRHFENALGVVRDLAPEALIPQSDGLTAGRLAEMIAALLPAASHTP
jgi:tetratricopeptide (TPR) repeat protein